MKTSGRGSARGEPVERRADRHRARRRPARPGRRRPPGRSPRRWSAGSHHQRPSRSIRTCATSSPRSRERLGDRGPRHDRDVVLRRRPAEQDDDRRMRRRSVDRLTAGSAPVAEEHDLRHELDAGLPARPRRATSSTRPRTSAAVPFRSLTMKFACFSETRRAADRAGPSARAASIRRPAESPGGLRNVEPADGIPSGWCSRRQRRISSRRPAIVAGSAGSRRNVARGRPRRRGA